jgi:hypothetical protein
LQDCFGRFRIGDFQPVIFIERHNEFVAKEKLLVQFCLDSTVIPARRARKVRQSLNS